jgi:hypothetical protein
MRYQHVERSQALAVNDVETLQTIAKRRIIDLKNIARNADSLLVFSVIRATCIEIDRSIDDALERARNLLK